MEEEEGEDADEDLAVDEVVVADVEEEEEDVAGFGRARRTRPFFPFSTSVSF